MAFSKKDLAIKTLGKLKASGYTSRSVKEELRDNLIAALKNKTTLFEGVVGYEETVIPDLQRAILSRHEISSGLLQKHAHFAGLYRWSGASEIRSLCVLPRTMWAGCTAA